MLLDRLLPSCREVARRLAEEGLQDLSWSSGLVIGLHLWHCAFCARFSRQLDIIRAALGEAWTRPEDPQALAVFERRLVERLARH